MNRYKKFIRNSFLIGGLTAIMFCFWIARNKMNEKPDELWGVIFLTGCASSLVGSFWYSYDWSNVAKSGIRMRGSRFKRTLCSNSISLSILDSWAIENKYVRHHHSSTTLIIFLKKNYPVYPLFVSVKFGAVEEIEAWVCSGSKDIPITKGFHFLGSLRIGLKDLNSLLDRIGEEKLS